MDQPLNNPNEDENQFYGSGQNNIYDNQGQPPLEELPPTKPGYYPPPQDVPQNQDYPSPQDLNVPPQNQDYPPPQDLNVPPQNMYYPPPQDPNSPVQPVPSVGVPLQSNIPVGTPVQQGIPVNNYPQPIVVPQPVIQYNNTYQQYNNVSQINHKGVFQVDENTFYVNTGCCFKIFPFIFIFAGLGLIALAVYKGEGYIYFFGVLFSALGIYALFFSYTSVYFIMGPNTLTTMKKAVCRRKTIIYNPGELQRIEFNHRYTRDVGERRYTHKYSLIVVPTNGDVDNIFSVGSSQRLFTPEEIDYFLYYINTHIQTNMRV